MIGRCTGQDSAEDGDEDEPLDFSRTSLASFDLVPIEREAHQRASEEVEGTHRSKAWCSRCCRPRVDVAIDSPRTKPAHNLANAHCSPIHDSVLHSCATMVDSARLLTALRTRPVGPQSLQMRAILFVMKLPCVEVSRRHCARELLPLKDMNVSADRHTERREGDV